MKQALVDIEDSRFYEHNGVDVAGHRCGRWSRNLLAGEVQEGGSTLTQQLVKQTLLQTATTAEERQAATEQTHRPQAARGPAGAGAGGDGTPRTRSSPAT